MAAAGSALRADAARNRKQILDAARVAFASDGIDVSMAEIARRAGVGFATTLRRFPTKGDLIREIVTEQLSEIHELTGGPKSTRDPWEALVAAIRACAEHQAGHPGLAGAIADSLSAVTVADPENHIGSMFTSIAQKAADIGVLRHDIVLGDVLAILKGNAGVIAHSPGDEGAASARFVELTLRGLRRI
ncbi:TetR/AcrR family transcriptional regulator [Glaciihabitans sp. dw_435]|uniref:TetR/AcrR family transcriptional regulator n=1 Tax=Glaciihabitans sp. dw_435 TaxID=2720081 RepID=UPI001BD3ED72|nr:TetR/AcrR family transcriptional regulator [Glaciihabitans sp. dw_435]